MKFNIGNQVKVVKEGKWGENRKFINWVGKITNIRETLDGIYCHIVFESDDGSIRQIYDENDLEYYE